MWSTMLLALFAVCSFFMSTGAATPQSLAAFSSSVAISYVTVTETVTQLISQAASSQNVAEPTTLQISNSTTTQMSSYPTSSILATTLTTVPYANTTSSTAATPSVCGEYGNWTLTWDDEPTFSSTDPVTDPIDAPPVFNPYHHLFFSDGFVYGPPPTEPFLPISAPRLVMFLPNDTGITSSPDAGLELAGEIGTGDRASVSAFWFNAYSAYLGCYNEGPGDCIMSIYGYVWQSSTQQEILAYQQNATLPPCPGFQNCQLQQVPFAKSMVGLSGLRIQALVNGTAQMWFMDNLAGAWFNNTCAAGLLRQRSE